jgi:hypothetical protein
MDKLFSSLTDDDDPSQAKPDSDAGPKPASAAGLNALDLADLPDLQRKVMHTLLRLSTVEGVSLAALQREHPDLPTLTAVLADLEQRGVVKASGQPPTVTYHAILRRKRGSDRVNWNKLLTDGE